MCGGPQGLIAHNVSRNCFYFSCIFPLDREVFWVFCITLLRDLLFIFSCFTANAVGVFLKELEIVSSEYSGTNIFRGGASVTPNEALPHIGMQPQCNAKDDRCNLPALL